MSPEDFVKKIRQSVIDENSAIYRNLFENTQVDQATDPYWREALGFFHKLEDKDKEILFKIMRQATVDTVSNMFSVFDGVSSLVDQDGDFSLTFEGGEPLNGDLQDYFLEAEEG